MRRILHLIGLAALTLPAWAGEYVVLGTGFRLHADRHEMDGQTVRIFSDGGVTEMPAATVAGFEPEITVSPARAVVPAPSPAPATPETPQSLAAQAARKYALPEALVRSVMRAESDFRSWALSPKGAIGLMQLMPETARQLGVDPRNPAQNADGGAHYLRELLARYESSPDQVLLALAAYNAGPEAVERYHGVPPFRETHDYILRVLRNWQRAKDVN